MGNYVKPDALYLIKTKNLYFLCSLIKYLAVARNKLEITIYRRGDYSTNSNSRETITVIVTNLFLLMMIYL